MDYRTQAVLNQDAIRTFIKKIRWHRLGLLVAGAGGLMAFFVAVLITIYSSLTLPDISRTLKSPVDPAPASRLLASDGTPIMTYGKYVHQSVPLEKISPLLVQSVLGTEDRRFYQHNGIDLLGVGRAIIKNVTHRGIREGGSTLSQQLARILFLSNERSLSRKFKEALLALQIERTLTKKEILALYLNSVYFGEGAYGAEAASRVYFNKPAARLRQEEAALLAGLIQAPSSYNPFQHPVTAKARRNEVLQNLSETGVLTAEQVKQYKSKPIYISRIGRKLAQPDKVPYFNRAVLRDALAQLHLDEESFWKQGFRVHTTLDPRAQRLAETQVRRLVSSYGGGPQQGALISLDNRNRIIAYVGGRDFEGQQFDHVRQAHRPAGSLFKILVYATAFQKGMTPLTTYRDTYMRIGDWEPHNYDKRYHGRMTLARALIRSNNIVAIKVLQDVEPQSVIQTARNLGVQSELQPNLSLALGAADVTLEEMTGVFSVFRANGIYRKPYAIERIEDRQGKVVYQNAFSEKPVLDRTTRDTLVSVMKEVMQSGTGRGAFFGRDAAGKTGTSDEHRDAWFIGFTPDVTTGIWVGNDDNSKMAGVTGGSVPAVIWRNYMAGLTAKSKARPFDLAYAMPINEHESLLASLPPVVSDPPAGPWALSRLLSERSPRRPASAVPRAAIVQRATYHYRPGAGAYAPAEAVFAGEAETSDKPRAKKWSKAWKKLKKKLRELDEE